MRILVIDGQGGKLGSQIVSLIKNKQNSKIELIAVGTNAMATEAMMKGKADIVATGENPVIVNSKNADLIIGPIGIVIADSMYGEVTVAMATAVSQSKAKKILIPINKCDNIIVGVTENSMKEVFNQINKIIDSLLK